MNAFGAIAVAEVLKQSHFQFRVFYQLESMLYKPGIKSGSKKVNFYFLNFRFFVRVVVLQGHQLEVGETPWDLCKRLELIWRW